MTDSTGSLPALAEVLKGIPTGKESPLRVTRPATVADPLYHHIKLSAWATAMLSTPPFRRLAGVSLSSVPGELLFRHPFPSRLDHAAGVYHLARVARPRDRALQLAALAHDLGHGPFSHLSEPLMLEWLGMDHEARSIAVLDRVRLTLPDQVQRFISWVDWADEADLMRGRGRGLLLTGDLDYDNMDNVARFKLLAGFGSPGYDPQVLARSLRLLAGGDVNGAGPRQKAPVGVALEATAELQARAWQSDRARVYGFLHGFAGDHENLVLHAMLRKAVDLAFMTRILPPDFFDLTDAEAFSVLSRGLDRGLLALIQRVKGDDERWHRCIWEAEAPVDEPTLPDLLSTARARLELEADLAAEAGLAPHEVILSVLVSNAARALPPLTPSPYHADGRTTHPSSPPPSPRMIHVFMAAGFGRDYAHRLRLAAERHFERLGARACPISSLPT
jgi:hypothetical protein